MLPGMSIFVRTLLALLLLVHHAQASTAGGCPSQGVAAARCIALDGGGWSLQASNGAALPMDPTAGSGQGATDRGFRGPT